MPLRPSLSRPDGPNMRVYDRLTFGNLVKISMIDGRQYRSREACYERPNRGGGHLVTDANCIERLEESRSMIGAAQERWLYQGLASSKTRWNIITQDVLIAQLRQESADGGARFWSDNWNGYPASLDFERSQMSVIRIHPFPLYGPLYLKTKSPAHGPRRFDRNCSNVLLARSGATVPQRKWQATC